MRYLIFPTLLLMASLTGVTANAKDTKALLAHSMWSAFECSAYASAAGYADEQSRLFDIGYRSGSEFLLAVQSGEISAEEIESAIPERISSRMEGPSSDFVIGRIYEASFRGYGDGSESTALVAKILYERANCALIR